MSRLSSCLTRFSLNIQFSFYFNLPQIFDFTGGKYDKEIAGGLLIIKSLLKNFEFTLCGFCDIFPTHSTCYFKSSKGL